MKIVSVIGARPQFVKAAVFRLHCLENNLNEILIHTGQHFDFQMSDGIFAELDVAPANVNLKLEKRSHGGMTGEMLLKLEKIYSEIQPDVVNLYGDTNTTLAGALAASKMNIPISHVEAGLRSFDKTMPEEQNRIVTDHLSTHLFCPTKAAMCNLKKENLKANAYHVGDVMFDAVSKFDHLFKPPEAFIGKNADKPLALLTLHRAENLSSGKKLANIIKYCEEFSSDHRIIFPVHPNTKSKLEEYGIKPNNIECHDPFSYLETQWVLKNADLVLTDSGGLQKEAYFHQVDCVTLRSNTEWIETVEHGWNRLWQDNMPTLEKRPIVDFGDGNACSKIVNVLEGNTG